jgi:putative ABC transport system permease protein
MRLRIGLFWEAAKLAMQSIWTHKLRAFLTLLGIIIGVASVVIVGAAINGLQTYVTDSVSKTLGSNSFVLARIAHVGRLSDEEFEKMLRRNEEPKLEDIPYLRSRCPDCEQIAAETSGTQNTYFSGEELLDTQIRGVTANMIYLANLTVVEGRFFSETEVDRSRAVCVIGDEVKEKFFPHLDPLGQTIKIQNQPMRVIGVVEKMGSVFGMSLDKVVYIPITQYKKSFGGRRGLAIRGKAVSRERFEAAIDEVRVAMRAQRDLRPNEDDDFGLISTDDINSMVDQFTSAIAMVIVPITAISLLVGGIVVMNIMLVSVTERTFEIGIRKAIGARRKDIVYQFLIEAFLLAASGGAVGLIVAYALAGVVQSSTSFPMTITILYIVMSLAVSGGIGIIFGIYPAVKASRLDPIVALTSER